MNQLANEYDHIHVVNLKKNVGKANAIFYAYSEIQSVLQRNDLIGFIDADASVSIETFLELVSKINGDEFLMGSREIDNEEMTIKRRWYRHVLGRFVSYLLRRIFNFNFKDTQCGAKVMTSEIAKKAFATPFKTQWFVDLEIILRIETNHAREVSIKKWVHQSNGHITLLTTPKIFIDLIRLIFHYRF